MNVIIVEEQNNIVHRWEAIVTTILIDKSDGGDGRILLPYKKIINHLAIVRGM